MVWSTRFSEVASRISRYLQYESSHLVFTILDSVARTSRHLVPGRAVAAQAGAWLVRGGGHTAAGPCSGRL